MAELKRRGLFGLAAGAAVAAPAVVGASKPVDAITARLPRGDAHGERCAFKAGDLLCFRGQLYVVQGGA